MTKQACSAQMRVSKYSLKNEDKIRGLWKMYRGKWQLNSACKKTAGCESAGIETAGQEDLLYKGVWSCTLHCQSFSIFLYKLELFWTYEFWCLLFYIPCLHRVM